MPRAVDARAPSMKTSLAIRSAGVALLALQLRAVVVLIVSLTRAARVERARGCSAQPSTLPASPTRSAGRRPHVLALGAACCRSIYRAVSRSP